MSWLARRAVAVVVAGTVSVALAYASAFFPGVTPAASGWLMVVGISLLLVGMMALGARRRDGGLGRLGWAFVFVFVVLVGCFGGALLLPSTEGPASTLVLGLPPRAALVLLGIGVLPTLVLPLAYALTFDEHTLRPEELERVRRAGEARRETAP